MKKILVLVFLALSAAFFLLRSGAQSTIPSVDLSVGPLGITTQPVNVAMALSVEFPTAGAAYRSVQTYATGTTYIGYWDSNGCYTYYDPDDTSALAGEYFHRTGDVDANGYCNTPGAGTGYSGNMLNWAATSSIDNLRLALTGGNRIVDTTDKTVLGRAYLPNQFNDGGFGEPATGYWPLKQIPASLVGKVTPAYKKPGTTVAYNGVVYIRGCQDRIFFGSQTNTGSCSSPGGANDLATYTPAAGTQVQQNQPIADPPPTNTSTTTYVASVPAQAYWGRDPSGATTTTMPSGTDLQAGTLVPEAVSPSPRNSTVIGSGNTPQSGYPNDVPTSVTWVARSPKQTTTSPPTQQSVYGLQSTPPATVDSTGWQQVPGAEWLLQDIPTGAPQTGQKNNVSRSACFKGNKLQGLLSNNPGGCPQGQSTKTATVTVYDQYKQVTNYVVYDPVPVYTYYQTYSAWYVPAVYRLYDVYTNGSKPSRMRAAVRVCDTASEYTNRTVGTGGNLCLAYSAGNYKPVGQFQRNALGVRASAFGYLIDNTTSRYGGVQRAPMKYLGPQYKNSAGALVANSNAEWDASTGVFASNPLGDSTYGTSGVINYLNKFGSDGSYKSYDPVGELWYEVLRYYQGLQPSSGAFASATSAMYNNFPAQQTWTDPLQNACQRSNFIVAIGDVNTWYDKQLPGLSNLADSTDTARAAVTIPGTTSAFDATTWTQLVAGFETNAGTAYTDSLGRAQTATGNPNPIPANGNLQNTRTGAGSTSAYYWAGAAYWANTQPIRQDTSTDPVTGRASSMSKVRVRTFTIDVDEGGNGSIDGNPRAIPPRQSSFYLAGKYGWFKDVNQNGNPFNRNASGSMLWEDPNTPNTPDGYVLASQAQKLIGGIQKFFAAAVTGGGSLSVSALSSQRYSASSQTGDLFSTSFDPSTWSGTLYKRSAVLNQTTFTLDLLPGNTWDAGVILTGASTATGAVADPYVRPQDRKIWTWGASGPLEFTSANLTQMTSAVQTALNTDPARSVADGRGAARIDYVRGDRSNEVTLFRPRASIMGDVINSGPVYKGPADAALSGAGYSTFSQSVAHRTPIVYVGANDGMVHAFRASDAKEVFAYVPRAVAGNLNKLTNLSYTHQPFVDGVPQVGEVQVGGNWRTVLAGGMGGGARGVYALDVTYPDSFGATNTASTSAPIWEFTNADDRLMGNILAEPKLVKINMSGVGAANPVYKWFVAVGSGYNNYRDDGSGNFDSSGKQALFLLSLDKAPADAWQEGTNYFKIVVPIATTSLANGLSTPGVLLGNAGEALALYAGDLQGQLWRFDLSGGLSAAKISGDQILKKNNGTALPIFTALDSSNTRQPITVAPLVTVANGSGYMIVVGTGKFMEPSDNDTTGVQAIYSVWDAGKNSISDLGIARSDLFQMTATVGSSTVTLSNGAFSVGAGAGSYKGCYFNLPSSGERVGVQGDQGNMSVAFNSLIPSSSCSSDGNSRAYQFNPTNCTLTSPVAAQSTSGYLSKPNYIDIDLGVVMGGNYHSRLASGLRKFDVRDIPVSATTGGGLVSGGGAGSGTVQQIKAGRLSWREVRSFN